MSIASLYFVNFRMFSTNWKNYPLHKCLRLFYGNNDKLFCLFSKSILFVCLKEHCQNYKCVNQYKMDTGEKETERDRKRDRVRDSERLRDK